MQKGAFMAEKYRAMDRTQLRTFIADAHEDEECTVLDLIRCSLEVLYISESQIT